MLAVTLFQGHRSPVPTSATDLLTRNGPERLLPFLLPIILTLDAAYIDTPRRRFQELLNAHSILGMAIALS
ncbi:hypothetical protein EMIT0P253_130087 [Pseudomonas sp. IT-P253]